MPRHTKTSHREPKPDKYTAFTLYTAIFFVHLNYHVFSILLGAERFIPVYLTAKTIKEPNYTDEDFAKIKLQLEQRVETAEIPKIFLSGFFLCLY